MFLRRWKDLPLPFLCKSILSSLAPKRAQQGRGLAGLYPAAHHSSLLSVHDTFLKLCPPGKYYKDATLTMDQVSSLPALRVSPGGWGGVGVVSLASAEGLKVLVSDS